MKLEKWALLAEVISGIAILMTLVVLVSDVRSNGRLLERQVNMERLDRRYYGDSDLLLEILEKIRAVEPANNASAFDAYMDRYDLTFIEAQRWMSYVWFTWRSLQNDFLAGADDRLAVDVAASINAPEIMLYLELNPEAFDRKFLDYVESIKAAND